MTSRESTVLVVLALLALLTGAVGSTPSLNHTATKELAGEPQHYSATVVRTVEGGGRTEVRVARSGDMRSSEWNQDGETRVSIWRPDLGRVFLLSLERQVYVESDLGEHPQPGKVVEVTRPRVSREQAQRAKGAGPLPEAIDRAWETSPRPTEWKRDELPEVVVDGRPCSAIRKRATFADGHLETTLMFCCARSGRPSIRVESPKPKAEPGRVK